MENYNNVDIIEQIREIIEKLRLKLASVINGLGGAPYKNYCNVSEINNALDRGMIEESIKDTASTCQLVYPTQS